MLACAGFLAAILRAVRIQAELTYSIRTAEKPVTATVGPGGRLRTRSGAEEQRKVQIEDGRHLAEQLSLDREGFVLAQQETKVRSFWDEMQLQSIYDLEIQQLIKETTGASRVLIFDRTLRSEAPGRQKAHAAREPVPIVHNDYTEWSARQRVLDLLPEEAQALLQRRFMVVQVWRPIGGPVRSWPLAICDAQSLSPKDLIAAERRHPNRVGEIYQVSFNPAHRWYYFEAMHQNEALVFKCYDSVDSGVARFTAHAAFQHPASPKDAPPRESIEVRTLAFFP